jgi:hypothetical protein
MFVRRPDPGVGGEPQHVGLVVTAELQQGSPGRLGGAATRAGVRAHVREPDPHGVAERVDQRVADRRGDRGVPGIAGLVAGVDQPAQRALRLLGPVLVGVALGGVGEVPQQVEAQI